MAQDCRNDCHRVVAVFAVSEKLFVWKDHQRPDGQRRFAPCFGQPGCDRIEFRASQGWNLLDIDLPTELIEQFVELG